MIVNVRCPLRGFGRSEMGGAMVELAVILPVLILFAVGVMDYGRVFFRSIVVANAARAGAEWGALDPVHYTNQAGAQAFAKLDGQEISGLTVTSQLVCRCGDVVKLCSDTCGGTPPDVFVEVTATDSVAMFLKYPGLKPKIGITRTAYFRAPP